MATSKTTKADEPVTSQDQEVTDRPTPAAPSFGMCEGTRADLEQVEKTTDPFTGKVVTRDQVK